MYVPEYRQLDVLVLWLSDSAWPSSCTRVKAAMALTRAMANDGSCRFSPASSSRPSRKPGAMETGKPKMVKAGRSLIGPMVWPRRPRGGVDDGH